MNNNNSGNIFEMLPTKTRLVALSMVFFITGGFLVYKGDYLSVGFAEADIQLLLIIAGLLVGGILMLVFLGAEFKKEAIQAKLVYGAVTSTRDGMSFDRLHSGGLTEDGLRANWNITDAQSAHATLDWLLNSGHSSDFDKEWPTQTQGVHDVRKQFTQKYRMSEQELNSISTLVAWDLDRLVSVARWCVSAKYVTHTEAWDYIDKAIIKAKASYTSWPQYFAAVVFGRTIWSEASTMTASDISVADSLLLDKKSIYFKHKWK